MPHPTKATAKDRARESANSRGAVAEISEGSKKVMVTMPTDVVALWDQMARREGDTRSSFLRRLLIKASEHGIPGTGPLKREAAE